MYPIKLSRVEDWMRLDRRATLFVLVLFLINMAAAQSAGVAKTVVIHAGRVLDVKKRR